MSNDQNNSAEPTKSPVVIIKEHLASYERLEEEIVEAQMRAKAALAAQHELAKTIGQMLPNDNKGFNYNGRRLSIVCRPVKSTGKDTWFIRGLKNTGNDDLLSLLQDK